VLQQAQLRLSRLVQTRGEQALSVLYIEDNPQDGELTARYLASHAPQIRLQVMREPLENLGSQLSQGQVDVLLLDYRLEDLNAFELLRSLQRGPLHQVPIVVVTGQGSEDVAVQALRMGVADYVIKDANYLLRLPSVIESAHVRHRLIQERERLRESEAQLLQLTRQVPGAIVVMRLKSQGELEPVYATDALHKVQGLSLKDLEDGVMQGRVHPDDRHLIRQTIEQAAREVRVSSCEYRMDLPQRGWRWFETQMRPEHQRDGTVLLYCYTFDITERKQLAELAVSAEAAQQANRAKTEFLSRMSHELRTPLNAVLGFAQLLQSDPTETISDNQRRQVRFIEQAGEHLVEMINDILDLSRIEAGEMTLALTPTQADQICLDAMALVVSAARQKSVSVSVAPREPGEHRTVLVDPLRLRQIMVNLLSNAVKYNRLNGKVDVSFAKHEQQVLIKVSDTGPGLSPDQQRHLFEPFNRLGAERTEVEGTGIGLVIVNKLINLMGGTLSVESQVGQGSCFTVALPSATCAQAPARHHGGKQASTSGEHLGHVLYAEDDAINAELMRQILPSRLNVRLEIAISGADAIAKALACPPDLLLLDMHLGDMDAISVSQTINQDARLKGVPRIALSADALPDQVRRAMDHGFADYLTKPVDVRALLASIERHLNQADLRQNG
jgi:PAS domain S-box-containing protein